MQIIDEGRRRRRSERNESKLAHRCRLGYIEISTRPMIGSTQRLVVETKLDKFGSEYANRVCNYTYELIRICSPSATTHGFPNWARLDLRRRDANLASKSTCCIEDAEPELVGSGGVCFLPRWWARAGGNRLLRAPRVREFLLEPRKHTLNEIAEFAGSYPDERAL